MPAPGRACGRHLRGTPVEAIGEGIRSRRGNVSHSGGGNGPGSKAYHVPMTHAHDVLIVGGGLVGSSLAIALDRIGLDVGLVEATPAGAPRRCSINATSVSPPRPSTRSARLG